MEKPFETLKRLENELVQTSDEDNLNTISAKYLKLGEFCLEIDAIEYGIKTLQNALTYDKKLPNLYSFYELLGHLYYRHGKLEESINSYKKYIKQIPKGENHNTHAVVLFKMGKLLMLIEKYEAAVKKFKESEKLYEVHGEYVKQAQLLYDIGVECNRRTVTEGQQSRLAMDLIITVSTGIPSGPKTAILKRTAKISFKKALKILDTQDLLESERELVKKIQSKI
jgi:tetratricopeptide (TPR) repeat protein